MDSMEMTCSIADGERQKGWMVWGNGIFKE